MHLALKAYQELLATVNEMDMSPDEAVRESSRIIKSEALACSLIPAFPISRPTSHVFQSQLHPPPFPKLSRPVLPILFSSPFLDNIFYVMEYRELFLALFRKFDERFQPRSFLRDLVETTHLFLKMLERFCRSRGNLVVQVLGRRRMWKELGGQGGAPALLLLTCPVA